MENIKFKTVKQRERLQRQKAVIDRYQKLSTESGFYPWGACRILADEFGYKAPQSVYNLLKKATRQ